MLLGDVGEDRLRLRPVGVVDGPCTFRVEGIFLRIRGRVVIEGGQGSLRAKGRPPGSQGKKKRCEQQ